jgi:hypothetical protein
MTKCPWHQITPAAYVSMLFLIKVQAEFGISKVRREHETIVLILATIKTDSSNFRYAKLSRCMRWNLRRQIVNQGLFDIDEAKA